MRSLSRWWGCAEQAAEADGTHGHASGADGAAHGRVTSAADFPPPLPGYTRFVAPVIKGVAPGTDILRCQYVQAPLDHDVDILDVQGHQPAVRAFGLPPRPRCSGAASQKGRLRRLKRTTLGLYYLSATCVRVRRTRSDLTVWHTPARDRARDEEAQRVGELLLPRLPVTRRARAIEGNLTGPFGEILANDIVPSRA